MCHYSIATESTFLKHYYSLVLKLDHSGGKKRQQNSATAKHAAFSIRKTHPILKSYHTKPKLSITLSKNQQIRIFKCCSPQHLYISNNINNLKYLRHYVWEQFTMQLILLGQQHLRAMFRLFCPCKRHMQCEEQQLNF